MERRARGKKIGIAPQQIFITIRRLVSNFGDEASEVETLLVDWRQSGRTKTTLANGCTEDVRKGIEHDIQIRRYAAFQGEFQRITRIVSKKRRKNEKKYRDYRKSSRRDSTKQATD